MSYNMNIQFTSKSKVLVCGASGMTGRNLYDYLFKQGISVVGTSHSTVHPDLVPIDFTSIELTNDFFRTYGHFTHVIIACAKTYNLFTCKSNPASMILPNITMLSNILSSINKETIKRVVYLSSATVYQPSFNTLTESDLNLNINPHPVYLGVGWAKRYMEKLCEFYSTQGLPITVVRPTNIYGPHDKTNPDICHVIPALIMRAISRSNPYTVHGNGHARKDLVFVDDLVSDIMKILECDDKQFNVFNLCSETFTSIRELTELILTECRHQVNPMYTTPFASDVPIISISRSKMDSSFGARKHTSVQEGIQKTVKWYLKGPIK